MLPVIPCAYAKYAARLLTESLIDGRHPDFEQVLARYLEAFGVTADYQLREDWLWGAVEIADFVGVSPRRVFGWVENGKFPHVKMGNGGIAARKTIILAYVFAQELASMRGISLKSHVPSNAKMPSPVAAT
jgi:hypothetical protein